MGCQSGEKSCFSAVSAGSAWGWGMQGLPWPGGHVQSSLGLLCSLFCLGGAAGAPLGLMAFSFICWSCCRRKKAKWCAELGGRRQQEEGP